MIKVKLKIISHLIYKLGFEDKELELPQTMTVGELLTRVNLREKSSIIIMRNGKIVNLVDRIHDGDRIVISPFFYGG
jgi:sulfur carrier protein ThiS